MDETGLLEKDGFLDPQVQEWIDASRKRNSSWLDLSTDTNRLAMRVLFTVDAHNRAVEELVPTLLYIRLVHAFQGVVLMAERGMVTQGRVLARSMLDTLFPLVAIVKEPARANDFVKSHWIHQRKFFRKAERLGSELIRELEDPATKHLMEEVQSKINEDNIEEIKTVQWAKRAGLECWYLTVYALLSGTVHSYVADLEEYRVFLDDTTINELNWGPRDDGLQFLMMASVEATIMAIEHIQSISNERFEESLASIRARTDDLIKFDFNLSEKAMKEIAGHGVQ